MYVHSVDGAITVHCILYDVKLARSRKNSTHFMVSRRTVKYFQAYFMLLFTYTLFTSSSSSTISISSKKIGCSSRWTMNAMTIDYVIETRVEDNSSHTCLFTNIFFNKLTLLVKPMFWQQNHDVFQSQDIQDTPTCSLHRCWFVGFTLHQQTKESSNSRWHANRWHLI